MASALVALALAALVWLTVFQLLLALGVPLGRLAWGGADRILPPNKRVASMIAAVMTAIAALCLADHLGLTSSVPDVVERPLLWVLLGLFALSTIANFATSSRAEKIHGVPLAAIITIGIAAAVFG